MPFATRSDRVVVNLLGVPLADRPKFFAQLLPRILEVKARTGRPHWLVVDETHHLLPTGPDAASLAAQLPDRGTLFITVHVGAVEPQCAGERPHATRHRRAPGANDSGVLRRDRRAQTGVPGGRGQQGRRRAMPCSGGAARPAAFLIHTQPPRTERKRHSRKYAEGDVGPDRSFYFRGPRTRS